MTPRQKKAAEKRVDRAFNTYCNGIQIPILKLGSIMNGGIAAIAENPAITDEALGQIALGLARLVAA